MRLTRLTLENFRSHEQLDLDLSGISCAAVVGRNGAGKSSILLAINWCLYGTGSADDLIRLGQDRAGVTIELDTDEGHFKIARGRERGKKSWLNLRGPDGDLTCRTIAETQERVLELVMGMHEEAFAASVYAPQGQAGLLASLSPGDRKALLGALLGLDRYEDWRTEASAEARAESAKLDSLVDRHGELTVEKTSIEDALAAEGSYKVALEAAQRQLVVAEADLDAALAAEAVRADVEKRRGLVMQMQGLIDRKKRSEGEAKLKADLEKKVAAGGDIRAELASLEEEHSKGLAREEEHRAAVARRQDILDRAEEDAKTWVSTAATYTERQATLQRQLEETEASEPKLPAAEECPTCGTDLAEDEWIVGDEHHAPDGYAPVEADFGHWLAGFIDGEGCFYVHKTPSGFAPRFQLKVREDDRDTLARIAHVTSIGTITGQEGSKHPQVAWAAWSKPDCAALVALLRAYPLRAKKARDFALWSEAVDLWMTLDPKRKDFDWSRIAEIKDELHAIKVYGPSKSGSRARVQAAYEREREAWARRVAQAREALERGAGELRDAERQAEAIRAHYAELAAKPLPEAPPSPDTSRLGELRAAVRELDQQQGMVDAIAPEDVGALREQWTALKAQADALPKDPPTDAPRAPEARKRIEAARRAASEQETHLARLASVRDRGKKVNELLGLAAGEMESLAGRRDALMVVARAFSRDGIPALLLDSAVDGIEAGANEVLEQLGSPYRLTLATQMLKKGGGYKETLEILVDDGVVERSLESFSGGEQYRVHVALRMGLARVLSAGSGRGCDMLLIDEPTDLDAEGIRLLAELLTKTGRQVLLVTHQAELVQAMPQRIHVGRDSDAHPSEVSLA